MISRTGGFETGARVGLGVGFSGWVALHTASGRNRFFEYRQVHGSFVKWVHRHEFEAGGVQTRLTDRIGCELPGGSLVNRFAHRHRVTKGVCEKHSVGEAL